MDSQALIALIKAQRTSRVEVAPGKWVSYIRPTEMEVRDFIKAGESGEFSLRIELGDVTKFVTGWEGFTEADLVGAAGASSLAVFAPELWAVFSADHVEWVSKVAKHMAEAIATYQTSKADAAKN